MYVLLKVVSKNGEIYQYFFFGAGQVIKRGALGVLQAIEIESTSLSIIGEKANEFLFKNIFAIVTDGATVNSCEKGDLWTLFEKKWGKTSGNNSSSIPLINIWCGVCCTLISFSVERCKFNYIRSSAFTRKIIRPLIIFSYFSFKN